MANTNTMNPLQQEMLRNRTMAQQLKSRMLTNQSAEKVYTDLKAALPSVMMPGNIGNLNQVIWPFWFTFNAAELGPNTGANTQVTVTQEAAFILMAMTKVVYKRTGAVAPYQYTAINALDTSEANANANGLSFTLRDAQSSRVFISTPMALDEIGCAEFPTVLPTPQLVLPNSTLECIYQNADATNVYVPFLSLFGYRLRIDNAQAILSTITGK